MPPSRRCKSAKSTEIRNDSRKSPRKKKVPEATEESKSLFSGVSVKTPKRKKRTVNIDKTVPKKERESTPSTAVKSTPSTSFSVKSTPSTSFSVKSTPSTSFSVKCTPSTSSASEKTCAFYRTKISDGKRVFSKSLMKYFLTVDSPEMDDLRNKRFNTSFIHEKTRRDKSDLKIFTAEEDEDPKWLENVPKLDCSNMPDIPGSEHAKIFESMPINGDSDEELKKLMKNRGQSQILKRRKSTRCTEFKGKPLPDQALAVDYTSLLYSESSSDDNPDDVKETEVERDRQETALSDAVSENKNSILLTLLSAPVEKPIKPYKYNELQPAHCYNISSSLEDKMLLNKYKDVMGDRQVNVVLTRLPIDAQLLELWQEKKLNLKSAFEEGKRVSKVSKYSRH